MKTMYLHKTNKLFILLLFFFLNISFASTWDIAVIFLGKNEDNYFQNEVSKKIKLLTKLDESPNLSISILNGTENNSPNFSLFFKNAFKNKNNKKLLLIYSHGIGPDGLKDYSTQELKESILKKAPYLDLLWFDACFMANLEFLYEIRRFSDLTIASEDSEFTSGLPLLSLKNISQMMTNEDVAKLLANDYIESYSFTAKGSQRKNVKFSSATISIIKNKNLDNFVDKFTEVKRIINKLPEIEKNNFIKTIKAKYSMDRSDLVDLGNLLIELRSKNKDKNDDNLLTQLIRDLNIASIKKTVTNPRLKIIKPNKNNQSIMVYGFNNFQYGDKYDYQQNELVLNSIIKPEGFIIGPQNKLWPYTKLKNNLSYISPFAPGLNEFNYYIVSDGEILENNSITRNTDIVEINQHDSTSPLIYSAYTQEIGKNAERYTGINISMPYSVPSIDYIDYEFNSLIDWLNL